jgi:hypothetical protein
MVILVGIGCWSSDDIKPMDEGHFLSFDFLSQIPPRLPPVIAWARQNESLNISMIGIR